MLVDYELCKKLLRFELKVDDSKYINTQNNISYKLTNF